MNNRFNRFSNFAPHQVALTAADADFVQGAIIVRCLTAGNCVATDEHGATITYPLVAGDVIPTLIIRIAASSTGTYTGHW